MSKSVVVISGGSEGLGKEIARLLTSDYQVIILARNEDKLRATAQELQVDYEVCDISQIDQPEKIANDVAEKFGRIDVLINNAGIWIEGPLDNNSPEKIKEVIDINTTGTILLTQAVLPIMKKRQSGRIINIISQAGLYGKAERSVYNASKWAITGFTKSLEKELVDFNITVTGIYPGAIATNLFANAGVNKDLDTAIKSENIAKVIQFLLSYPREIYFPEVGIKNIKYDQK